MCTEGRSFNELWHVATGNKSYQRGLLRLVLTLKGCVGHNCRRRMLQGRKMAHIIDSRFYGNGYGTSEMRKVFADEARFQRWLDVEAALAVVQGKLGVIPEAAAQEISAKARLDVVDLESVKDGIARTNHSLVPLLKEIQGACSGDLGEFIHYGVTTQDIEDTGAVLEMKDAYRIIEIRLCKIVRLLSFLAEEHRDTVMTGRTHGQHALVTTFGYKVAVWLDEVLRHLQRMEQAGPRIFRVSLSGGVGTMSALPKGLETMRGVAEELGLATADTSWHTARDGIAEYVTLVAMIGATIGKISNEVYVLAKTEFGELAEPHHPGKLGSSTMPHKRNPEFCEQGAMLGRLGKYAAAAALESMAVEHDRDGRAWRMDWAVVPEVSLYVDASLSLACNYLAGLEVNKERMKANIGLQKDFLFSEALMIELGKSLGKQTAHHVVYECAMEAHAEQCAIIDLLLKRPDVSAKFTRSDLEAVIEPSRHLGEAQTMTDLVLAKARQVLQRKGFGADV